ncbi:unnamed protein product [Periconia digitata]|uniref:Uncharacterized protein n=1 Tax=Periconia digitata TaxID=1303443 RepID=A0A9W4UK00_9PLEO|nr:unnamed protein product [Periconia digitata]
MAPRTIWASRAKSANYLICAKRINEPPTRGLDVWRCLVGPARPNAFPAITTTSSASACSRLDAPPNKTGQTIREPQHASRSPVRMPREGSDGLVAVAPVYPIPCSTTSDFAQGPRMNRDFTGSIDWHASHMP